MAGRYAILLDGGFVTRRLWIRSKCFPTPDEVLAESARISAHPELQGLSLLRIYFYDAPPATTVVCNPLTGKTLSLARTPAHAIRSQFHKELELRPNVALRSGDLLLRGWRLREKALREIARTRRVLEPEDLELDLVQKGVDLRIGLDIARLSLRQLVNTIVVVTGDSYMVPAFKFARREGIRVFLDPLGGPVKRDLKAHADLVL